LGEESGDQRRTPRCPGRESGDQARTPGDLGEESGDRGEVAGVRVETKQPFPRGADGVFEAEKRF
jgi:hypothetical protein